MSFKETTVDLSWNVRGAYNKDAKRHIRDMIRRLHPSIFIIMETHIQYAWVQSFWESQGYKPIAIIEAIGHFRWAVDFSKEWFGYDNDCSRYFPSHDLVSY